MSELRCHGVGCDKVLHPKGPGHPPKWCSEACRKRTLYGGTCRECGALTTGDRGPGGAPGRCSRCYAQQRYDGRRWTREVLIAEFRRFAAEYGRPPSATDWGIGNIATIRRRRAAGFDQSEWPNGTFVQREFGSWRAGLEAAGFTPNRNRPSERAAA